MGGTRLDVVNVFVTALVRAIRVSLGEEARPVALHAIFPDPPRAIEVSVELTGNLRGPVTWSFSPELAREVASHLLLQPPDDDTAMHADAVADLANIVSGNAAGELEAAGFLVELRPPVIHRGPTSRSRGDTIAVSVALPSGHLTVRFDLEEVAP
jgi:CheY-specific phosphatase CheX